MSDQIADMLEIERLEAENASLKAELAKYDEIPHDKDGTSFSSAAVWRKRCDELSVELEEARACNEHHKTQFLTVNLELAQAKADKDSAYLERNKVVAALARLFPSGIAKTAIEGWNEEWHSCVYIDLPTGQVSWHYHDSQAYLFAHLPPYAKPWDGHDTEEKYKRLLSLDGTQARQREARLRDLLFELHALVEGECPSLLNEDSGGNARLALDIEAALTEHP